MLNEFIEKLNFDLCEVEFDHLHLHMEIIIIENNELFMLNMTKKMMCINKNEAND